MWYVGGKIRLSKDIVPILQNIIDENNITTFIDICCGGCNIIDKVKCENRIANDVNEYLIEMWNNLDKVDVSKLDISKEHYDEVKNNKDKYPKWYVGLVGFHYSYGGKFFGGFARSRYSDHIERSINKTIEQYKLLKDVKFTLGDYSHYSGIKGTLIYADIPYKSSTQTTTKYRTTFDYDRFWNWVRMMSKNNIVVVSELEAPSDFEVIWSKNHNSNMSYNKSDKTEERLFSYDKKNIKGIHTT